MNPSVSVQFFKSYTRTLFLETRAHHTVCSLIAERDVCDEENYKREKVTVSDQCAQQQQQQQQSLCHQITKRETTTKNKK